MANLMDGFRDWIQDSSSRDFGPELACSVAGPATAEEIAEAWHEVQLPPEVLGLWRECREAKLFADVEYGQWGMRILTPQRSASVLERQRRDRPSDFVESDVVVAEFLGDLELLVLSPSEEGDRRVLVALELDHRPEWYGVGSSLAQFFQRYLAAQGEKFWEQSGRS